MNSSKEQERYERERDIAIEFILDKGLVKPKSIFACIAEMVRNIGLRYIFWDTWYSIFFAAVTIAGVSLFFFAASEGERYSVAVATAPLLFLAITVFAEISERLGGLYELKQTCRYTIRQITAMRIICYSIAGLVFTTVISAFTASGSGEFLSLLILSLAALLLCAALILTAMRFIRSPWATAILSGIWILANTVLTFSGIVQWENILSNVSLTIPCIIAAVSAAIFMHQASKLLKENNTYAYAQ